MKKKSLVLATVVLFFSSLYFLSCKKINEATELGGDLLPAIDNVHTFETFLETETDNKSFLNDTTSLLYQDQSAIGVINDPEFGKTEAAVYFEISSAIYSRYPFLHKDLVQMDSVVLSLAYTGAYGDSNTTQTLHVFEVSPSATINDTSFYKYTDNDFATTGSELGSKSFNISSLKDTIPLIRKTDTTKVANVVRIRLNNSLGNRFAAFDTTNIPNGGFYNDSIFQTLFKGLAIKADAGSALTYFDVFDNQKTKLTVYFRSTKDGKTDTSSADFYHLPLTGFNQTHPGGVANIVKRTPGGNWASYLVNGLPKDDKIFIQSAPGSFGSIKIPGLDNMQNSVVHLAELVIYRLPSAQDNIFTPPSRLFLDRVKALNDSAFDFERDQVINTSGLIGFNGGDLKKDNTYRFNITRYVQGILTRKEPNMLLRLYAPLQTNLNVKGTTGGATKNAAFVLNRIADGRVVVGGGNYSDPNLRMRLRLVYSIL